MPTDPRSASGQMQASLGHLVIDSVLYQGFSNLKDVLEIDLLVGCAVVCACSAAIPCGHWYQPHLATFCVLLFKNIECKIERDEHPCGTLIRVKRIS